MSTLYEIESNYLHALDAATDPDNGLDPELFADTLEGIEGEAEDKIINVLKYAKNLEVEANAIKDAMDNMKARMDAKRKRVEWLKAYALHGMKIIGKAKIERPDMVASMAVSQESVVIDDESLIPKDYFVVQESLSKTLVRQALKDGFTVPGAHLERGTHLRIK